MPCCLLSLLGCDGGGFASELTAKPKARVLPKADGAVLRLPKEEAFSIALFDAQKKTLGPDGTVLADAQAKPDGHAAATAGVTSGGQATANFQLGHALQNESDKQVDIEVVVRYGFESKVESVPGAGVADASVGLNLYARDGQNRLVRTYELLKSSNENGLAVRQGENLEFRFTLTLGPNTAMNVFVAGQAAVDAKLGRAVSGTLKLTGLQMEIAIRPAPAVRAGAP